jgi:hypothetical protein
VRTATIETEQPERTRRDTVLLQVKTGRLAVIRETAPLIDKEKPRDRVKVVGIAG